MTPEQAAEALWAAWREVLFSAFQEVKCEGNGEEHDCPYCGKRHR